MDYILYISSLLSSLSLKSSGNSFLLFHDCKPDIHQGLLFHDTSTIEVIVYFAKLKNWMAIYVMAGFFLFLAIAPERVRTGSRIISPISVASISSHLNSSSFTPMDYYVQGAVVKYTDHSARNNRTEMAANIKSYLEIFPRTLRKTHAPGSGAMEMQYFTKKQLIYIPAIEGLSYGVYPRL